MNLEFWSIGINPAQPRVNSSRTVYRSTPAARFGHSRAMMDNRSQIHNPNRKMMMALHCLTKCILYRPGKWTSQGCFLLINHAKISTPCPKGSTIIKKPSQSLNEEQIKQIWTQAEHISALLQ
ncbi:hypothetical protein O181_028967 [Austropuccinia psidii MF-1]|uniref:Uncharacterized protein n=1 Tax=Austropuccinia psidii MF-1 TaxID=1389203 RepID=A0A9Q3H336_9BASI|nr:hypothetical protein [Austropuccinia psidii MF-1]